MIPLDTCDAIERFLSEQLGKVRLPSPAGGETSINFYQMNLPQPGAQTMNPRQEDTDGNEIAQSDDDIPLDDGGYTRNEARQVFPAVVIRPVKEALNKPPHSRHLQPRLHFLVEKSL
jgi:hypothetical protein